jgi:hypothetical protein
LRVLDLNIDLGMSGALEMAFNLKDLIVEALTALGGAGTAEEVRQYIKSMHGKDWKNIESIMDDLRSDSESAFFSENDKVLRQVGKGKYSLKQDAVSELPEAEASFEEPKISSSNEMSSMIESTVVSYFEKLKHVLNQPVYGFERATSNEVSAESGVYIIHNDSVKQVIYAGRSRNLRIRLLQQHKQGNIEGSQFRKALGQKYSLGSEAEISAYIRDNCSFQFLPMESFEEMVRLEHFVTAILAPILNTELKQ